MCDSQQYPSDIFPIKNAIFSLKIDYFNIGFFRKNLMDFILRDNDKFFKSKHFLLFNG